MTRLDLPEMPALIQGTTKIGLEVGRGLLPSEEDYASRVKFHGRGERMGFRGSGRIHNLNVGATIIKGRPIYRDDRVAPVRRIQLAVDLSNIDSGPATRRLLSVASVVCGVLLALPHSAVTVTAFGCRSQVQPVRLESTSALPLAVRGFRAMTRHLSGGRLNEGKIRFACIGDGSAHVVVVSHYLDARMMLGVGFPLGCTTVLVEPPLRLFDVLWFGAFTGTSRIGQALRYIGDWTSLGSAGVSGGVSAGGPAFAARRRVHDRYEEYGLQTRRLGVTLAVRAAGSPLEEVATAVGRTWDRVRARS